MDKQPVPETMLEAVRRFADPQVAHDFWVQMRWPDGVACPLDCGSVAVAYMPRRRRWYCRDCKGQFTAKVGTIFEDSPIGFDKWLPAIWLIASNRNGISSYELARGLQVTQRTAWFMLHRIREAMKNENFEPLKGTVEVDETFIGGKWHNKPLKKRRALGRTAHVREEKAAVFGMVERKGRVRAWSVPDTKKKTLLPKLRDSIDPDATVYTDGADLYKNIDDYFLHHAWVNHYLLEYVRGNVHTNNIECFWAVLKRTIAGTYTHARQRAAFGPLLDGASLPL
jgi:transposase-like protein